MKPVSYTPRNSFTEIIMFRMTQKNSNLLHMTGQVRVPFQHRSQHPASFVGNFTDQAPCSTVLIHFLIVPSQRLDFEFDGDGLRYHRYGNQASLGTRGVVRVTLLGKILNIFCPLGVALNLIADERNDHSSLTCVHGNRCRNGRSFRWGRPLKYAYSHLLNGIARSREVLNEVAGRTFRFRAARMPHHMEREVGFFPRRRMGDRLCGQHRFLKVIVRGDRFGIKAQSAANCQQATR